MSTYYRREERDRDNWDTRSTVSRREVDYDREGYTTKKVYRVGGNDRDDDRRTIIAGGSHRGSDRGREQGYTTETRVVRRVAEPEPEPEVERREIRITERSRERPREEPRYERVIYKEREDDRLAPYRPYMREEDYIRPELEKYTRETNYYPPSPQPIIIRQEPQQIIIQEAPRAPITVPEVRREEDFQLVQRSDVREERSVAKSEVGSVRPRSEAPPKPRDEEEEDYYYERRVRKIDDRDDYHDEDRYSRRERDVSPGSSISQRGARRRYSSDDSYDYVRKEEYGYDDEDTHHRRHLAEGAIAGIGAAELLRHHRSKEGGDRGSRHGRVGRDVGAAALGVVGAEAVSRARSHYRSKSRRGSRERDRSGDREGRRRRKDKGRDRSRSESHSRAKQLAGLGLGAAAIAAAAAYANKQSKEKNARPSRSRTRRGSVDTSDTNDARNPQHRNTKIAQAGLAGAAVAGLVERARSKSKGRNRSRSKSRIRQGIPIAAAGLGSAAIAGLYEKNQAGKKEKEQRAADKAARRQHRDRDRSRSRDRDLNDSRLEGGRDLPAPGVEAGMIEYGDQPVYGGTPYDQYARPASQQGYYGNHEDAMVPAAAAAGGVYGAQAAQRERERSFSGSDSGSERRRRRRHRRRKSGSRSRSRTKDYATAGLAAGAGALAMSEHEKKKARKEERRREKEERRRREAEEASYGQDYQHPQFDPQQPGAAGYPPQEGAYAANQPYYPPPPNQGYTPGAEYNAQGPQIHPDYGFQPQQGGYAPPDPNAYSPPPGANPYAAGTGAPRRADENVSAEQFRTSSPHRSASPNRGEEGHGTTPVAHETPLYNAEGVPFYDPPDSFANRDGLNTPRAHSPSRPASAPRSSSQPPPAKSVQFALDDSGTDGPPSPEAIRHRRQEHRAATPASTKPQHHHRDARDEDVDKNDRNDNRRGKARKTEAPAAPADDSDSTEDLPDRFDTQGRRIPEPGENPMLDKIQEAMAGKGTLGGVLRSLGLAAGAQSEDDEERGDGGRQGERRRRRDGGAGGSGSGRRRRRRDSR